MKRSILSLCFIGLALIISSCNVGSNEDATDGPLTDTVNADSLAADSTNMDSVLDSATRTR